MATRSEFIFLFLISFVLIVKSQYEAAGYGMPMMSLPDPYIQYMNYYQPQPQTMMEQQKEPNDTAVDEPQNNTCPCYCDTCAGLPYCCSLMCFNCYGVPPDDNETIPNTTTETVTEITATVTETTTLKPETTTAQSKKTTCPPPKPCNTTYQPKLRAYPNPYRTKQNRVKTHDDFVDLDKSKWIPKFGVITLPESIAERLAQDLHALIQSQLAEQMSRNPYKHITSDVKFPGPPDRPIIPVLNLDTHDKPQFHNHNGYKKDYTNKYKERFKVADFFLTKDKLYPDPVIQELVKSLNVGKKSEYN